MDEAYPNAARFATALKMGVAIGPMTVFQYRSVEVAAALGHEKCPILARGHGMI